MRLISFRILNFKSIIDSGESYLSSDLTILAGKNESGKTNILDALEHFNLDKEFKESHFPKHRDGKPRLELVFEMSREELPSYNKDEVLEELSEENELRIKLIKEYPSKYYLSDDSLGKLGLKHYKEKRNRVYQEVKAKHKETKSLHSNNVPEKAQVVFPDLKLDEINGVLDKLEDYKNRLKNNNITNANVIIDCVNKLIELVNKYNDIFIDKDYAYEIAHYMPYFILFKSFDDILPNRIDLEEDSSNQWIRAFEKISDLNIQLIKSEKTLKKRDHKKKLNLNLNQNFKKYWKQDDSNISIDWDGKSINFFIEEEGEHFTPRMRSKGKQWYLSFYILVSAKTKEDHENIILIDEPGLYLHAQAQKEITKRLENLSSQIIFSTHSPYLIEKDKLNRVKAVIKRNNDTIVEDKLHKVSDKETLTPVLTTIGLGINDSVSNIKLTNNIIVEGPSDYYYINAFTKIAEEDTLNIIHGGGATNMPHVGTILQGWDCKVYYLFDNDEGYRTAKKNIDKNWECTTKEMIGKIPIPNSAIEDVFSRDDYHSLVLNSDDFDKRKKNSTIAKETDKVLKSKLFYEKVLKEDVSLDDESLENIEKLIGLFNSKFQK